MVSAMMIMAIFGIALSIKFSADIRLLNEKIDQFSKPEDSGAK